ncbi:MAG: O-antigen ligase family protein, partial [Dermatophilaceae bacterium]
FSLVVLSLFAFAAAVLRGQPAGQVTTAATSLVRLLSWGGPLLIAMDGVRTTDGVMTMVRRLAVAGGLLALLGMLQFVTGQSLLGWVAGIPGVVVDANEVILRGGFARASGTSMHPLEHSTALSAAVAPALVLALHPGRAFAGVGSLVGWMSALMIALGSVATVSRSAVIGFAVAVVAFVPALPSRLRALIVLAGSILAAAGAVAFPGIFSTMVNLFMFTNDSSTDSRTDALARIPEFAASSPLFGIGFGTFLPRYYILDNQWAAVLVELGILGFAVLLSLFTAAMMSAIGASRATDDPRTRLIGRALAASVLTVAVVFAFFDGLSFPIAAGTAFTLFGLCAALNAAAREEAARCVTEQERVPLATSPPASI